MEAPGHALPVFEDAPASPMQAPSPVEPAVAPQEESSQGFGARAGQPTGTSACVF